MARETKVGLITGLAFIICFAVILANRGAKTSTSHIPYRVDGGANTVSLDTSNPSNPISNSPQRNRGNQPASARSATPQQTNPGPRVAARQPDRVPSRKDSGTADVTVPFRPKATDAPGSPGARAALAQGQGGSAPSTSRVALPTGAEVALTSPATSDREQRRRQLEDALDARLRNSQSARLGNERTRSTVTSRNGNTAGRASGTQSPARRQESRTQIASRYTVKSGDSLSRIAANHYGRATNDNTRSLFEANRDVLKSPDRVIIGMELKIPRLAASAANPASNSGNRAQTPRSTVADTRDNASAAAPIKWYQIKKSDRYASIARDQLGDASRWPEIFELNRDKFPDPQMIRAGVRIKLPPSRVASSTERGH